VRLLVLAREKVDAATVRSALPGEDLEGAEVLVVSPAEETNPIKFIVSDVDDAIAEAEDTAGATAGELRGEGAHARTETGESDPLLAIQDALAQFPADRILVFGDDEAAQLARERFDVPVQAA
jgi:hypothetical protein